MLLHIAFLGHKQGSAFANSAIKRYDIFPDVSRAKIETQKLTSGPKN